MKATHEVPTTPAQWLESLALIVRHENDRNKEFAATFLVLPPDGLSLYPVKAAA